MAKSTATTTNESELTLGTVRYAAMSLLARREHARAELQQKLSKRFPDHPQLIATTLEQLEDEGLQSDERFTEAFVAMRMRRGQGPRRIAYELQQRDIGERLIADYLYSVDQAVWLTQAAEVCDRKYGKLAREGQAKAKQMRFLQYRGFSPELIHQLWRQQS